MTTSDPPPSPPERRPSPRRRALLAGLVVHSAGRFSFPCTIKDMSEGGIRIQFAAGSGVPSQIEVINRSNGIVYHCDVIWTTNVAAGLKLTATYNMKDLPPELDFLRRFR
ncbi:MAG: PilZ domain-containing protein [Pseudomonadota bacterium]